MDIELMHRNNYIFYQIFNDLTIYSQSFMDYFELFIICNVRAAV